MIETPQPCLGACIDRRLDLVGVKDHAGVVAVLAVLERALAECQNLVARLARSEDPAALRPAAQAALRLPADPPAGEVITTWACDFCGRIEAPQPCIGVCIRPETPMVRASEHRAVLEELARTRAELERLAPPLRQLAWSTPRPRHAAEHAHAVQAMARTVLS
jgi:hypothetical protein